MLDDEEDEAETGEVEAIGGRLGLEAEEEELFGELVVDAAAAGEGDIFVVDGGGDDRG